MPAIEFLSLSTLDITNTIPNQEASMSMSTTNAWVVTRDLPFNLEATLTGRVSTLVPAYLTGTTVPVSTDVKEILPMQGESFADFAIRCSLAPVKDAEEDVAWEVKSMEDKIAHQLAKRVAKARVRKAQREQAIERDIQNFRRMVRSFFHPVETPFTGPSLKKVRNVGVNRNHQEHYNVFWAKVALHAADTDTTLGEDWELDTDFSEEDAWFASQEETTVIKRRITRHVLKAMATKVNKRAEKKARRAPKHTCTLIPVPRVKKVHNPTARNITVMVARVVRKPHVLRTQAMANLRTQRGNVVVTEQVNGFDSLMKVVHAACMDDFFNLPIFGLN